MTNQRQDDIQEGSAYDMLQLEAWAGLMSFLLKKPEARTQFEAETGTTPYRGPATGIEAMIDAAAGYDPEQDYLKKFISWATPAHWGGEEVVTPSIRRVLDGIASQPI